ncbi:unnamed protein product [Ceratitis capitata]|uniref:(Mediterranean fruit fly) hypothetical protein n=1 Tax=Ceratitis capitata TaxID=7213 RepID=A0A811V7R5_CERCA|nr:unnamed protein product [Ceratitis capitata]
MQALCKNHFLQQLYRKIDGAVLWSQNERNLDCIITFQTHSILQRFMLRFDMLQLDCNDHLYVYDGAHAVATPKNSTIILDYQAEASLIGKCCPQNPFASIGSYWDIEVTIIELSFDNYKSAPKRLKVQSICVQPNKFLAR